MPAQSGGRDAHRSWLLFDIIEKLNATQNRKVEIQEFIRAGADENQ